MSFDMEGIGSEVSQKIRAAIKAKLIELGAYVDDELPDYIMVMVANKRTRSQMDEDLQLFLSSNTKIFTTWLHTVLQKLHEVTVATFEGSKQTEGKKSKEKKSIAEEGTAESRKSSEERVGKVKKHNKKHKESKKAKKNKHKSKEKVKLRSEKKHRKGESKDKSENEEDKVKTRASQGSEENESKSKTSKDKMDSTTVMEGDSLGTMGKSEKRKSNKSESSSQSSSSSENSVSPKKRGKKETENAVSDSKMERVCLDEGTLSKKFDNEKADLDGNSKKNRKELIEDEFNIEPLEPKDKVSDKESVRSKESVSHGNKTQTTISAPTEELLKVHDQLQNQKFEEEKKRNKKENEKSDSEDSLSPEEMRKQLLLNRAKKRLEESKLTERMKSTSPDILIEGEVIRSGEQNKESRSIPSKQAEPRSSPPHSALLSKDSSRVGSPNHRSRKLSPNSSDYRSHSPGRKNNAEHKSKQTEDKRRLISRDTSPTRNSRSQDDGRERKKDVIKISESLEIEKKFLSKKDSEKESAARKALPSRVVTITEPEAPEIPSVVKVKPREFVAKEKQANKNLILKAVAEAEKSIATIPPKHKIEAPETKKREGLFTKDLREKRLQNIEVTISKISNSDSLYRRISKDSAGKSDKSRTKHQISEVGESYRKKSDLSCRKTSQSEDQFISSKTSGMEKNDKYIRCWLEGVEKAVKEDVMIDPNKMEDLVHSSFTDEEREHVGEKYSKSEDVRKRKKLKTDLYEEEYCKNPKKSEKSEDDRSPQIVVTMDGLNSKTLKDIITKSKESVNGPLILKQKERREKSGKVTQRLSELPEERSPSSSRNLTGEKISDRFGRINPVNEVKDSDRRKTVEKTIVYHSSERDNKESKNRELIARLSEKFGKVDREFESKKRKYPEEDRRYQHESGRSQKDEYEKNGKYRKSDRRFPREDVDFKDIRVSKSRDRFKF